MNEQAQEQNAGADAVGYAAIALAVLLVIGGIAGYYLLDAHPDWQRWGAAGLGLVAGLAVFAASPVGRRAWQFALDSRVELRKVVWPSRQETLQTTLAVFMFVTAAGVFFWVVDWLLAIVTKHLTGQGS
jgi:preprotein translocase subunit SecE